MKKYYPQEHMKTSNKNVKEIAGYMIAFQKKKKREREKSGFRKRLENWKIQLQKKIGKSSRTEGKNYLKN